MIGYILTYTIKDSYLLIEGPLHVLRQLHIIPVLREYEVLLHCAVVFCFRHVHAPLCRVQFSECV